MGAGQGKLLKIVQIPPVRFSNDFPRHSQGLHPLFLQGRCKEERVRVIARSVKFECVLSSVNVANEITFPEANSAFFPQLSNRC